MNTNPDNLYPQLSIFSLIVKTTDLFNAGVTVTRVNILFIIPFSFGSLMAVL